MGLIEVESSRDDEEASQKWYIATVTEDYLGTYVPYTLSKMGHSVVHNDIGKSTFLHH